MSAYPGFTIFFFAVLLGWYVFQPTAKAQPQPNELEAALYARAEFFGAQAIVPLPLNEARQRLAALQQRFPQDAAILLKAAELDEQLGSYDNAETQFKRYVTLSSDKSEALHTLAAFYGRRAQFAQQAATLAALIEQDTPTNLADNLRDLLALARKHGLNQYLSPAFFKDAIARQLKDKPENEEAVFSVISQYMTELQEQKRWSEVVTAVRVYRAQLPQRQEALLLLEVNALVAQGKAKEAEAVYDAAFDPFWSEDQIRAFYWDFLSERDRLRAYGQELRAAFRRHPTDFNLALRLARYRQETDSREPVAPIFIQLEQARALRHQSWTDVELATVARLFIAQEDAEGAARYLYTLAERGGLQPGNPLRAEVLYQLFRLLIDHADQRTPLTQGDLRFYADVAVADPHPGLLGGVLSFVLSDTNPARRLEEAEERAVSYFNSTTAFRLFEEYKQERPTAPQLAQMYCELITQLTKDGHSASAAALLVELEARYADAPQRVEVALHLADHYAGRLQKAQEQVIYRNLLTHFSQQFKQGKAKTLREVVEQGPRTLLDGVAPAPVSYADVLHRYVASLTQDKRTNDILALYADALKTHPDEPWLYEEFLAWLESVNLVEQQLTVYQAALQRFDTMAWTDRLARWFVRRERQQDFERLSRAALAKFDEQQTVQYLAQHLGHAAGANAKSFDAQLYRALYAQAHERFPHAPAFVNGLLRYHEARNEWDAWRALLAEHFWEAREWRELYLRDQARRGQLRASLDSARAHVQQRPDDPATRIYQLFQAEAAAWLSQYEEAASAYRALAQAYPQQTIFAERAVALTRSFGQRDAGALQEAAQHQQALADAHPAHAAYRTTAGELYAEQSDYARARQEWNQLLALGAQDEKVWLDTATVFWDYFQYDDALRILRAWRKQRGDETRYAFQLAAILDNQHQTQAALAEYVKALDPGTPDHWRARQRLSKLAQRKGVAAQLHAAWLREAAHSHSQRRDALTLGYVRLLTESERWPEAAPLLRREIARSTSSDFLNEARDYFRQYDDAAGELLSLQRLAAHASTTRFAISYRLQLAEHAARQKQTASAARQLQQLVQTYPSNYGVICEASDLAWNIGERAQAMRILQQAQGRARGRYRYQLSRRLAAKESARGAWAAAEKILARLHTENPRNLDVFAELAHVAVRTSHAELLRERYRATIQAIKDQDELDRLEQREQIAEVRGQVIEAFTALRDYAAAVEQHIEIINRDPDDAEKFEAALRYCQRYGGADALIAYYSRAAREAFKDYRWNFVLARLYGARRDWPNALAQYRQAIHNQPELLELHEAQADAALQANAFEIAIQARERACELTNDAPAQRLKLITALEKAGRTNEAAKLRAQLPQAAPRAQTLREQFAAAAQLGKDKRKEALAQYRQAFARFAGDFYQHSLSAADWQGYVETLRDEESLDQIAQRIWELRERVQVEAVRSGNAKADRARSLLAELDRNFPETLGRVASERATGDELRGMRERVPTWAQAQGNTAERDARYAVLLNLCWRGGLGDVAETLLIARKDAAYGLNQDGSLHHERLQRLLDFYAERGAYERALTLLVAEAERDKMANKFDYARLIAEQARLLNDRSRELQALRQHFSAPANQTIATNDELVERYLGLLHTGNEAEQAELATLVKQPTARHFQVLSFLLRHHAIDLARAGIDAASQPALWKQARHAELSLVARTLTAEREAHFLSALSWQPIGELVQQDPASKTTLQGDAWFALAASYGRWLTLAEKAKLNPQSRSAQFLPALLELRPKDAGEQTRLGQWLLEQEQFDAALEALQLASEVNPRHLPTRVLLGTAYAKRGERQRALAAWQKLLDEKNLEAWETYGRTLIAHGFASEARAALQPILRAEIERRGREWSYDTDKQRKELDPLLPLARLLAKSFKAPETSAQARYWQGLLVKGDVWLASAAIGERWVARAEMAPFYEWLIAQSPASEREDYEYVALRREHSDWSRDEIELALDHQAGANERETTNEDEREPRLRWQQAYLRHLLGLRQHAAASQLALQIERALQARQPRPLWLRLAQAQLELRAGRLTPAHAQLEQFVGLTTHERLARVTAPRPERLSRAVKLLNDEGQARAAETLAQAVYERQLALGQLTTAPLLELARSAWRQNNAAQARQWLALLVKLGDDTTRETAQAEVAALPSIKARALHTPWIETPEERCEVPLAEALRVAAEVSATYAQFDDAIAYRQRLLTLAPDDDATRLELARALAAARQPQAAGELLATVLVNRQAMRAARWQAVWLADELETPRAALWQALLQRWQAAAARDGELQLVLSALSQNPRVDEIKGSATWHVWQAHRAGQTREALQHLVAARVADANAEAAWLMPEVRWALVRLYAGQQQAGAALRLSERDERLSAATEAPDLAALRDIPAVVLAFEKVPGLVALPSRIEQTRQTERVLTLEVLAQAAERLDDIDRALRYEVMRLTLVTDEKARALLLQRMETLQKQAQQRRETNAKQLLYAVDGQMLALLYQ